MELTRFRTIRPSNRAPHTLSTVRMTRKQEWSKSKNASFPRLLHTSVSNNRHESALHLGKAMRKMAASINQNLRLTPNFSPDGKGGNSFR